MFRCSQHSQRLFPTHACLHPSPHLQGHGPAHGDVRRRGPAGLRHAHQGVPAPGPAARPAVRTQIYTHHYAPADIHRVLTRHDPAHPFHQTPTAPTGSAPQVLFLLLHHHWRRRRRGLRGPGGRRRGGCSTQEPVGPALLRMDLRAAAPRWVGIPILNIQWGSGPLPSFSPDLN